MPHAAQVLLQHGQRRRHDEREHQQQAERENQAERQQARADRVPPARVLRRRHVPDLVEAVFQLGECARRADQQQGRGDHRRQLAAFLVAGAGQDRLDGFRALLADEAAQFVQQLALGRIGAVKKARDRDDEHENRRQREQRVEGKRGALARCPVAQPFGHGTAHHVDDLAGEGDPVLYCHRGCPPE